MVHANQHVPCSLVLITWEVVMGAKHEKVNKKMGAKGRLGEKKCSGTLVLIALTTTMGKYNVRDIPQSCMTLNPWTI